MGFEVAIEKKGPKQRIVYGVSGGWREDATERVWRYRTSRLIDEGGIEERIVQVRAASEWRLSPELRHHEFFNRVVKETPTGANARLIRIAGTPGNTDPGRKSLVVSARQACRHTFVAWHNQARSSDSDRVA